MWVLQKKKSDAASAALQAEKAERASLAERLTAVIHERDAIRQDTEQLRVELASYESQHNAELQSIAADHAHAIRDLKRLADDRVSETKAHAKREIDGLKGELVALQAHLEGALQVWLSAGNLNIWVCNE